MTPCSSTVRNCRAAVALLRGGETPRPAPASDRAPSRPRPARPTKGRPRGPGTSANGSRSTISSRSVISPRRPSDRTVSVLMPSRRNSGSVKPGRARSKASASRCFGPFSAARVALSFATSATLHRAKRVAAPLARRRRHRHRQRIAGPGRVVLADPQREIDDQRRQKRLIVDDLRDVADRCVVLRRWRGWIDDAARHDARAQRHGDACAFGRRRQLGGTR